MLQIQVDHKSNILSFLSRLFHVPVFITWKTKKNSKINIIHDHNFHFFFLFFLFPISRVVKEHSRMLLWWWKKPVYFLRKILFFSRNLYHHIHVLQYQSVFKNIFLRLLQFSLKQCIDLFLYFFFKFYSSLFLWKLFTL